MSAGGAIGQVRAMPLGMYAAGLVSPNEALRTYFKAGIPVLLSADGQTFRPERTLPSEETPAPKEGRAIEL